jgi:CheY-like chemotaxis protein
VQFGAASDDYTELPMAATHEGRGWVLVIDHDQDIVDLTHAALTDAGFIVSVLISTNSEMIRVAIGQLEPDCVLLDGESAAGYGGSWAEAAWLSARSRPVPVVMFTTDQEALREVAEATSQRSQFAGFTAVLGKPFDIDELVDVVSRVVGYAVPFDVSPVGETQRTARLRAKLEAAGAHQVHVSTRREWANFQTPDGTVVQICWWQRDGVYYVIRHAESGGHLDQVGRFYDLDTAIALGMSVHHADP